MSNESDTRTNEQSPSDRNYVHGEKTKLERPNDIEPDNVRLPQNFAQEINVQKALLTVPVRKPHRQEFVRVHPDPNFRLDTAVLEVKEDKEIYLVDRSLWHVLPGDIVPKVLCTTINRQNVLTLWPIRLPGEDGRVDEWSRTALEGALMAQKRWVKIAANMSLGAYEIFYAGSELQDPVWPDVEFREILNIAFRDRFIRDMGHQVLKRLRGES